ncbi:aminotransferase class IV [Microbulbifer zhoushanensis]|uniref:aminotransferase class IV n=1 Tax=Microbulbifer TaxID=48073 RepID=UPI001F0279AA
MNLPLYFRNGIPASELPPDAGLGDGLLETMRLDRGCVPLWYLHRRRLLRSGRVTVESLREVEALLQELGEVPGAARLRLRLAAGAAPPYWDLAVHPLDPREGMQGVRLYLSETRLEATETANPGCKLLQRGLYNRASAELHDSGITVDALLRDRAGRLIETTRCNLLVHLAGDWLTPDLGRCGVRGVMRDWLAERIALHEVDIDRAALEQADELALCNGVRGVLPVVELDGQVLGPAGPETRRLQQLVTEELW